MKDNLIVCKRCGSNACYEAAVGDVKMWHCFGCGFASNSDQKAESIDPKLLETLPELFKDISFTDEDGYLWLPTTINNPNQGMLFPEPVDGGWKWAAVPTRKTNIAEKHIRGTDKAMDMKKVKHFEQGDYMEALDFIGYFNM
jgi:hypothetical protein